MTQNKLILAITFFLIVILFFQVATIVEVQSLEKKPEPMTSFGENMQVSNVTGVNIPSCAFIVDTRGRNLDAINDTFNHEVCHELVNRDKEHYCGG